METRKPTFKTIPVLGSVLKLLNDEAFLTALGGLIAAGLIAIYGDNMGQYQEWIVASVLIAAGFLTGAVKAADLAPYFNQYAREISGAFEASVRVLERAVGKNLIDEATAAAYLRQWLESFEVVEDPGEPEVEPASPPQSYG